MAWRPTSHLMEGELDNTRPGKVTGWLVLAGMDGKVVLDLAGDFHRDIRGTRVRLIPAGWPNLPNSARYLRTFSSQQTGVVGDMTAGLPPHDYVYHPYFEWYSQQNGRVLLTPSLGDLRIIGMPIPAAKCRPVSRQQQEQRFAQFLRECGEHPAHWIA